uniref:Dynein regulatory complex subunit 4 n=1 Tax=Dicentrarchus labrax TaxID=13489 RepID=A0A8C4EK77_DICLA
MNVPSVHPTQTEGSTQEAVDEKSPAVMDGPPTVKKSKDELWDECVLLLEEVERVQKQKKHFKLERDKAQRSWDNSKRNLEETKARMKERLRLKHEAEKRCQAEFDEHKEKLRQLEATQHVEVGELKMAAIATDSKTQKEQVESDVDLQRKMCNLQTDKREKECNSKIYVEKLKQKQHEELKKLHESYKNKVGEMEAQYDSKQKILVRENNDEIQIEFKKIDERMKIRTETVVEEQSKIWEQINYIIRDRRHVIEIKRQQGRVVAGKELNKRLDRRLEVVAQKNTRLRESLREQRAKLRGSRQQLVVERKAMAKSVKRGNKLCAQVLHERRELNLKHQQLELKHEQVQKEYDELQRKQTEAILDAQQKSGLKELLLERKITAVTETLEREQLKLWVALAFGQGDQTAATHIKVQFYCTENYYKI